MENTKHKPEPTYITIAPFMMELRQDIAAEMCGLTSSTFSKRWFEAVGKKRKWPYRSVTAKKMELETFLRNIKCGTVVTDASVKIIKSLINIITFRTEEVIIRV